MGGLRRDFEGRGEDWTTPAARWGIRYAGGRWEVWGRLLQQRVVCGTSDDARSVLSALMAADPQIGLAGWDRMNAIRAKLAAGPSA